MALTETFDGEETENRAEVKRSLHTSMSTLRAHQTHCAARERLAGWVVVGTVTYQRPNDENAVGVLIAQDDLIAVIEAAADDYLTNRSMRTNCVSD